MYVMKHLNFRSSVLRYASALGICGLLALACLPLVGYLDLANIIMLFLLAVALIAVYLGRGPAILAAFCSVALFDVLFVPPRFSFSVNDGQYLLTFLVMLIVALLISHLTTILQKQLEASRNQERQTRALYDYARQLTGVISLEQVTEALQGCLRKSLQEQALNNVATLFLPDANEQLPLANVSAADLLIVNMVYRNGQVQEGERDIDKHLASLYLPLHGSTRMRGVLAITLPDHAHFLFVQEKAFFQALASLTATVLERLHFVEIAQSTELQMQSEKLRSSILSALSHDIRTPLTALCGLADTLKLTQADASSATTEMIDALRAQALSLHNMVGNLLDMARLQSGKISLRKEWQPLEEVIGASIHLLGGALSNHPVKVLISPQLPLLNMDAVLMERVFCNLLENASKYSPEKSVITINAKPDDQLALISIHNEGDGFPDDANEELLNIFERGKQESSIPGFGIGLAICRSIIETHGGNLRVFNAPEGGACVEFTLPLGTPPKLESEPVKGNSP